LSKSELRQAGLLLVFIIIGMIFETLSVGLIIPLLTLLSQDNEKNNLVLIKIVAYLGNTNREKLVMYAMFLMLIIYTIKTVFLLILSWKQNSFVFNLQNNLSQRLYSHYLNKPYLFHLQNNSGTLISNITTEVTVFTFNVMLPLMVLLTESLVIMGMLFLLIYFEPLGTLIIILIFGLVSFLFQKLTSPKIQKWGNKRQFHEGMRVQHLQQGLGGVKEIKLLGRENSFLNDYGYHNLATANVGKLHQTLMQAPRLWIELLTIVCMNVLIFVMIYQHYSMASILPILGLFAGSAYRLMPSMNRILNALQQIRYALPVVKKLDNELSIKSDNTNDLFQLTFNNNIELDKVTFMYPESTEKTITNISLKINKGQTLGVIGESGSGKSTLIDILLGLLPINQGTIKVDNKNIADSIQSWQRQIGYVPQSIFLTDDTLKKNIALGICEKDIDEMKIFKVISLVKLDAFVETLENGIETKVGERGVRMSGGQRQRIGIARALYNDPEVLVLDEATSALDNDTEISVMDAINLLHGTKTIIIIAHRLSTLSNCDKIIRLEKGKIVFEGTFDTILNNINENQNKTL
jgi:ABC-type multidrug transport system fused ATPase/permease subunit